MFVHCTAAIRVGGFWLIRRVVRDGMTWDAALEEARKVGPRRMRRTSKSSPRHTSPVIRRRSKCRLHDLRFGRFSFAPRHGGAAPRRGRVKLQAQPAKVLGGADASPGRGRLARRAQGRDLGPRHPRRFRARPEFLHRADPFRAGRLRRRRPPTWRQFRSRATGSSLQVERSREPTDLRPRLLPSEPPVDLPSRDPRGPAAELRRWSLFR